MQERRSCYAPPLLVPCAKFSSYELFVFAATMRSAAGVRRSMRRASMRCRGMGVAMGRATTSCCGMRGTMRRAATSCRGM